MGGVLGVTSLVRPSPYPAPGEAGPSFVSPTGARLKLRVYAQGKGRS
jgi:hypothetical protein